VGGLKYKGYIFEKGLALELHSIGVPLIIDSYLLNFLNLGQVDISFFKRKKLVLVECKSNFYISTNQRRRLRRSAGYLKNLFSCDVDLFVYFQASNEYFNLLD